ncbi:phage baseplate assembly protein V [Vibrio harveyi]|uniref:Gp5/Type VI secretion system Vgr protein OB-fold domain-containing protein n=1 Tax=Vibrio harveyi TaxID=669 RepID=A0A8B3DTQ1_VIBHA|nr:phage baseplate assembly protein V [Vibrio harveyi]RIW17898.1 hypothetical protein DS957_003790 [Vibrio harveyi]
MSEQLDQQKRTNTSNKLYGRYRAAVVNTVHPDALYMVTVRVLDLWEAIPDEDLPYAEFLLPLGAKPSHGHAVPVETDDLVWVEFPRNGDTRYPLITGSVYHAPRYESNLPDDVNNKPYQHKRSSGEPTPEAYDRKDDLYERWGLREQKSHTGGWQITHVASGTAIEITPDGQCVIHTEGDQWRSATGNLTEQFDGDVKLNVGGGQTITINKDSILKAKNIIETADMIRMNGGKGVVTGECICAFTGKPHSDMSACVTAGKN